MNKWRRFRRLSRVERRLLLQALFWLPVSALGLRLVGFRRLHAALSRVASIRRGSDEQNAPDCAERAHLAGRMVAAASREGFFAGNCLEQSLTLWWLLQRQQIPVQLRIGVRKQPAGLEAHAWVEFQDLVLNDGADVRQRYSPLQGERNALPADSQ